MTSKNDKALDFLNEVSDTPEASDLFGLLSHLEALTPDKPRIGDSKNLNEDIVLLKQHAELIFAPSTINNIRVLPKRTYGGPAALIETYSFGLSGPNGPLPMALSDYIIARKNGVLHPDRVMGVKRTSALNSRDSSLYDFINIFNHRFLSVFYKSWASSKKVVDYYRADDLKFNGYIGSLSGLKNIKTPVIDGDIKRKIDKHDSEHLYFSGYFSNGIKHAHGLKNIVSDIVDCEVELIENVGQWLPVPEEQSPIMDFSRNLRLGDGLSIGDKAWDNQLKFELKIGPVSMDKYRFFYDEKSSLLLKLRHVISLYTNRTLFCFAKICLKKEETPFFILGNNTKLGFNCWLQNEKPSMNPQDLNIEIS